MAFERIRAMGARTLARTTGFYLSVVAFVFVWLLAFDFQLYAIVAAWFDPALADTVHFVHDIALAAFVVVWGVAMLAQLYRPAKRVTAMQVAILLTTVDIGVSVAAGVFDPRAMLFFAPVFVAAALHPARGEVFGVARVSREEIDPVVLGLAALAVVPVTLYVLGQLTLQSTLADEHAALDHYATMGYFAFGTLGLAVLAAVRSRGRRFAAYGAGLMAALFAAASVFAPTASGLDPLWSGLAAAWAVAVVGACELSARRVLPGSAAADESPATGRGY